jgi:aldehyde:ferredoxin oxidoreductase
MPGYAGTVLRIDLTSRRVERVPTDRYLPGAVGGIGIGYRAAWEETPADAGAFDPENVLFFGVGPLTGTYAPSAGHTTFVSKAAQTYPVEQVIHCSLGGSFGTELKLAGYDAVIVVGRADEPVYLAITDDEVRLEPARELWGLDTFATQARIRELERSPRMKIAAIGRAGEQLSRVGCLIHGTGHAVGQGGLGGVAGSKNLKAIAIRGTGAVSVATPFEDASPTIERWLAHLVMMQSVRPSDQDGASRWRARGGLEWRGGPEVVPIGEVEPGDLNRIAHRGHVSDFYSGGKLYDFHVKNASCTGCPIACYGVLNNPNAPELIPKVGEATCLQYQVWNYSRHRGGGVVSTSTADSLFLGKQLCDLHGYNVWDSRLLFGLLFLARFGADGAWREALDPDHRRALDALPWGSLDDGGDGGMSFLQAVFDLMIASEPDDSSLGSLVASGSARLAEGLGLFEPMWSGADGFHEGFEGITVRYAAHGMCEHYGPRTYGMATGLTWATENRDPNRHELNGLVSWSGLTWPEKQRVAEIHFGTASAIDDPSGGVEPVTAAKVELARFLSVRAMLKDALTVCDWVLPNYCCPDPAREYAGDLGLEAEMLRLVTGEDVSMEELDLRGEHLYDLHRALTVRDWNTVDLRGAEGYRGGGRGADRGGAYRGHDNLATWQFAFPADRAPHEPGGPLSREDFERAKTLFYERMGWDPTTGAVTRAKLEAGGLADVADDLERLGLLPLVP